MLFCHCFLFAAFAAPRMLLLLLLLLTPAAIDADGPDADAASAASTAVGGRPFATVFCYFGCPLLYALPPSP